MREMAKDKKFIAFDLGAESGRGVLGIIKKDKLELKEIHRFANGPVKVFDHIHWDLLRQYQEIKNALSVYAKNHGKWVDGIGFDTWGVDFGLLDKDGNLLGNPYHYRDKRTDGMLEEAFKVVPKDEIFRRTGVQFMQLNTLYQLLSMKLSKSPSLDVADKLLMMSGLFNYLFTGRKVEEFTLATTSQCYDSGEMKWSEYLFKKLNLPYHIMPEVVKPGTVVGKLLKTIADDAGMDEIPVIAPATHDTGSAVAAVPAEGDNWAFLSSGTWSLIGMETKHQLLSDEAVRANVANEGGVENTFRFLKNIMGLWIVQECKRKWDRKKKTTYDELSRIAKKAKPFTAFIDPNDGVFLKPADMESAIVEYCRRKGQKPPKEKAQIVRVILESIGLTYRRALEELEKLQGRRINVLHIIGGGSQNELLCQFASNATGRTVTAGPVEATAIGNIMVQGIASGVVSSVKSARAMVKNSFRIKTYEPKDADVWGNAYKKYLEIIC